MRILYVGFRDSAHSSAGGYDPIARFPGAKYLNGWFIPQKNKKNILFRTYKKITFELLYLIARIKRPFYDITHIFYGDSTFLPFHRSKKNKIVFTIHLDFEKRVRAPKMFKKMLLKANGVIVLSTDQERKLKSHGINAKFIPHGFSTPQYKYKCPEYALNQNRDTINIFLSGKQYRDSEAILETIKYCYIQKLNIKFHLCGQNEKIKSLLSKYDNVIIYPRLDDDEYYSLLYFCDYNFLPLTFATANNALLESQFIGTRSILPLIPGIEDYAAPFPSNLFYRNTQDLKKMLSSLNKNENKDISLLEFSKRFHWENIYPQLEEFYRSL